MADPPTVKPDLQGPILAIGVYVVVASSVVFLFIVADLYKSVRKRQFWIPCYWMSVNALSLSIIAVVIKFANDSTTPMPGGLDQLTKLSGSVLTCTLVGFILPSVGNVRQPSAPSLGGVGTEELRANLAGLGLLLVSMVVNISTQLSTRVISRFQAEHIVVIIASLLTFIYVCVAALGFYAIPEMLSMSSDGRLRGPHSNWRDMKISAMQAWVMARTSSKQYVVSRSPIGSIVGVLTTVSVAMLILAMASTRLADYDTGSEFGWTVWPVFAVQLPTIFLSWIIVCVRWWRPIAYKEHLIGLEVDDFWKMKLRDFKRRSITHVEKKLARRCLLLLVTLLAKTSLCLQIAFVWTSKVVCSFFQVLIYCSRITSLFIPNKYIIMGDGFNDPDRWELWVICLSQENWEGIWNSNLSAILGQEKSLGQTNISITDLISLLSRTSPGFRSLQELDSDSVSKLQSDSLSCIGIRGWNLAVVSLLTIMKALQRFYEEWEVEVAFRGYRQAADLMMYIEKWTRTNGCQNWKMDLQVLPMQAADKVFWGLEFGKWLDHDITNLGQTSTSSHAAAAAAANDLRSAFQILIDLANLGAQIAENRYNVADFLSCSAGNNLYRLTGTIFEQQPPNLESLKRSIENRLADVIGACLMNLPRAVHNAGANGARYHNEDECLDALRALDKGERIWERMGHNWPPIRAQEESKLRMETWMYPSVTT